MNNYRIGFSERKLKFQKISLFALLLGVEILLFFTPLGFIPIGPLNLTTLHIPVILSSLFLGPIYGGCSGFIFGILSLYKNTFLPSLTSFVFSPFVSFGNIGGNFWSLVICIIPRIILGILPAIFMNIFSGPQKSNILKIEYSALISAILSTLIHTFLVLSGIYIFFGEEYAIALKIQEEIILKILGASILTNGVLEAILASIISYSLARIYFKFLQKQLFQTISEEL